MIVANATAEFFPVQQVAKCGDAVDDFKNSWALDVAAYCNHARTGRSLCANCGVCLGAIDGKPWQVGKGFHVVDDGGLAIQAVCCWEKRWLQARHAAVAFKAFDERGFFTDNVCTCTPVQHDVYRER